MLVTVNVGRQEEIQKTGRQSGIQRSRKVEWGQTGYAVWKNDRKWTAQQTVRHSDGQTSRKVWLGTDREHMLEGIQKTDVFQKRFFFCISLLEKQQTKLKVPNKYRSNLRNKSKEQCKDQELILLNTTPDLGHHYGKVTKTQKTSHTREPRGQPFPRR